MSVHLFMIEHDRGELAETSLGGLTAAKHVTDAAGAALHAVLIGEKADPIAGQLAPYGVGEVHRVHHEILSDYGPDAWASALVQLADSVGADAISATGTERGNEVMAHVGALTGEAVVANCIAVDPGADSWEMTRIRWGGSLHERARLSALRKLVTHAPHTTEASYAQKPGAAAGRVFTPELDDSHTVTMVRDRVTTAEGITLATAPVVVSGGRGVGSTEGFEALEALAAEVGGMVGCSRVVTNNGWRNHRDQVGQTGTVVAPDLYIACGISGAIQHWVGMMNAKQILAINTDKDAPMVTKATWAVIADLHEIVPAITAELQRRKG
ncbi:MAG: electron transfer flavoprotein subunit alpha/FixB family protein [Acidimicrobiia bacterium]|nr:electron transfer flavoprotein subunit alpha/FixB family protein [Acidimicrobiia bacterium]